MTKPETVISWILKGGVLATPLLVFVVTRSLYFPFITGKNFAFRIIVELLALVWGYALLKYPSFRPRSSPIVWAVLAFIAVMGLATVFSLSPYRSFWSHFERMEGYIGLLHLTLYFLIALAAFRSEREWILFFATSLGASAIVTAYGFAQLAGVFTIHQGGTRVDATFGNATYLAAYLLFHLFFIIWFFARFRNPWLRAALALLFFLEAVILYRTATRGVMLGVFGGLVLLGAFLAILERGRLRRFALAGLALAALVPIGFFLLRDTDAVRHSEVLGRFRSISLTDTTTQARFTIWKMAIQGWRERPILGWGQESFIYVFSKHYDPSLWRQEPWFDRAHNVFLDWLIAGGLVGLAAYLALFAAVFWALVKLFRSRSLDAVSTSVFAALLAGYFFQNLLVFDNLISYLFFFSLLAYVHTRLVGSGTTEALPAITRRGFSNGAVAALLTPAVILMAFLFYFGIAKPILADHTILEMLRIQRDAPPAGKADLLLAQAGRGLRLNSFGTMELREQLAQVAVSTARDADIAEQDRQKLLEFVIAELETQRQGFPFDVRARAFLASVYIAAKRPPDVIRVANELTGISPRRQQFLFLAAEAYFNAGAKAQAVEALRRALEFDPEYPEAFANLTTMLILAGQEEEAESLIEERFGKRFIPQQSLARAYFQVGNLAKAARVWELVIRDETIDYRFHAQLGLIYAGLGRTADAIREIERAIAIEPRFRAQGGEFIRDVRSGKIR